MYKIEIYNDKNGKSEIMEYITYLKQRTDKDSKIKFAKIVSCIRKLEENGLSLQNDYIKHIVDELWELRPLRDRILFAYVEDNKFVLLSIFMKKTQKTPIREILKAKRLLKEYKERRNKTG